LREGKEGRGGGGEFSNRVELTEGQDQERGGWRGKLVG